MKDKNLGEKLEPSSSPPACVTAVASGGAVTTIHVKAEVAFGNTVYIRGDCGGLSWDRGILMTCLGANKWHWSGMAKHPIAFKVLLNDQTWSVGEDLIVKPGEKIEVEPKFSP